MIDGEGALGPVLDGWRELATAAGNAFVTPEWYLAALSSLEGAPAPAAAVARADDGAVVGVLPLLNAAAGGRSARLSMPAVRFADVFALPSRDDSNVAATAIAPPLAARFGRRSELELGRVPVDAAWPRALAAAWPGRMTVIAQPADRLQYVDVAGTSWDDYLATRSGQFRSQLGRKMRALRRDHAVRLRRTTAAGEVANDLATLFRLHDERWRDRPDPSSLGDPRLRELHRQFAAAAHERGWLRLFVLEVDGAAAAAWYGWRVGDRFSYYQAGFDPAWSRYSIGFLLLAETVREAIEEGADEYDLLLGDEAFKARFANAERFAASVLIAPAASASRATAGVERLGRASVRAMPAPVRDRIRGWRARRRHGS